MERLQKLGKRVSAKCTPQEIFDSEGVGCSSEPTGGFRRKVTVYGLNGRRAYFVITLSLVTYEYAI
jgi:hypothetical protein